MQGRDLGRTLGKPVGLLRVWAETYGDEILVARETFERSRQT